MAVVRETTIAEIVEQVVSLVRDKITSDHITLVERFVRQYYDRTAAEDLVGREPLNLYGAALAHWNFARQRKPGAPKVHVYNPQFEQHGWQSTHTIVEIVNDDMPFIVDSVRMALNRRGLTTHLVIHPVMRLRRDNEGRLAEMLEPGAMPEGATTEAIVHCEVDRQTETDVLEGIREDIERALGDVRSAGEDWSSMQEKLHEILGELKQNPPPVDPEEVAEARAFLEWIDNNHFTFLGYREYELSEVDGDEVLRSIADSGLGILRNPGASTISQRFSTLPEEARKLAHKPEVLIVTKGNSRSTVHRPGYLDYLGVKRMAPGGKVVGERRFVGLYTSAAYNRVPRDIPLLRHKVEKVVSRAGYPPNSHATKALQNILDTFPREVLFQINEDELFETALGILHLQERQRIRLFVHRDPWGRFFSCIVYVPRERFNTQIRLRLQSILEESFNGESTDFTVQLTESVLARLYFVVRVAPGARPDFDVQEIESRLVEVSRSWKDDLYDALIEQCGEEQGTRLYRRYCDAFKADYRERYNARTAVNDVEMMESLNDGNELAMSLYRPLEAAENLLQFKLFRWRRSIPLSEALPMLENMGLKVEEESPSKMKPATGERVWLHDFGMLHEETELDLDRIRQRFQDAFLRVWRGDVENDGFNRLVLRAGLRWREIVILRAYCKYLRQAAVTFSQTYMEAALADNSHIAKLLVRLFHIRFDPDQTGDRNEAGKRMVAEIEQALDAVANLDEDRILRSFLGLIRATLRTNYYQTREDRSSKPYLSFKFDPSLIPELPEPRPMFEIFVYSPRVEGVHLRGGKVARGGLRWSDRREDFRTEVLGLMKAQMVKNAVIIPVGSKGGFVAKALPSSGDREAVMSEVVGCYRTFIRGLLDLTDNLVGGAVVPPPDLVRHDEDDPYLVVAADKGTATFSDIANGIAEEYGFWLGDAFASGGSQGYDHKKMGITAKGAWESVKRHFRELGVDTQTTEFSVVGIGDMGGDVFGNGMLLSEHIKLVAAFNHMHIFLDPDPDPAASYKERKRLFELPRSSWADYDQSIVSTGGGVHPRSAKSIELSPEVRHVLGVDAKAMTPNELIRVILKAPVDLLWNGGIGTYVKASDEVHSDAGDRANDSVRVDAAELRCRVIGEGGNLGVTQLGRIEFALQGGYVNTDAIDNAGGVDCSDHEVNIKILLNGVVANGDMTVKQRNKQLQNMTDEVAALVLRNNYLQTQALSAARAQAPALLDVHTRFIEKLERDGALDRGIEFLPIKEAIEERAAAGRGLCEPELAVLLAYCKITLFQELLDSGLSDDPVLASELVNYFPKPLRDDFRDEMPKHRLCQEIISTNLANNMVNRVGITFAFRLSEETGAGASDIARAYTAAREVFDMENLWAQIEALDNRVPAQTQTTMLLEARKLVERASRWLLRNRPRPLDVAAAVSYFTPGVSILAGALGELVGTGSQEKLNADTDKLVAEGVPEALAKHVCGFDELFSALDIVAVATSTRRTVEEVAAVYFNLGAKLELHWLRDQIVALPRENRWQALARAALRDDLYSQTSELTADVLRTESKENDAESRIEAWFAKNWTPVALCRQVLADLRSAGTLDFAMLSVAMREIRALRQVEVPTTSLPDEVRKPVVKRKRRTGVAA